MRVIVYALLLINLLYFGWAQWIDVPPEPATSSIAALPQLKLASDLPPAARTAPPAKMALQTPPPQCVSVGPFDDPAIAAQAAAVLKAKNFAPQQRATESPAVRRFWVYLDGFRSDASEMRVLHRLEGAGIDDAEAMPEAAGGRRVSLGLFTDRDHAGRRAKVVQAMGFKPATTERLLPGTVYWLDLSLPNGAAVPLKDVSDLEPGGGSSGVSVQSCASASSPPAPSQQADAPATQPVTQPSSAVPSLPVCKPDGSGPVPCVLKKANAHPSVL